MRASSLLLCALLAVSPIQGFGQAVGAQDPGAERASLIASITDWKLFIPQAESDPLRKTFLPVFDKIEAEARQPDADLPALKKQFTLFKNLLMSELQAHGGFTSQEEFLALAQERMKGLLAVRRLETGSGSQGMETIAAWKAGIQEARDSRSLDRLYDNIRASGSPVRRASSVGFRGWEDQGTSVVWAYAGRRPEQVGAPPYSTPRDLDSSTLNAVISWLRAKGAQTAILGKVVVDAWREAKRRSLDPALVLSVILQESRYNPRAVSHAGARGLMQIMPATGWGLGLSGYEFFDPEENVKAGIKYLAAMRDKFGDIKLALAAYNAGPGNVRKYKGIPPFRETRGYVQKIHNNYLQLGRVIAQM